MEPPVIAALIGLVGVLFTGWLSYRLGTRHRLADGIAKPDEFGACDYVRHMLKHKLPLEGVRAAFRNADSVDQLAALLKALSKAPVTCDWFKADQMKGKYLLSINLARRAIDERPFNRTGAMASSDDPDEYAHH